MKLTMLVVFADLINAYKATLTAYKSEVQQNKALEEARAKWGKAEVIKNGECIVFVTEQHPDGVEVYFPTYQTFRCPSCGALSNFKNMVAEHFSQHHLMELPDATA